MNKHQLKKLIREVLLEVEGTPTENEPEVPLKTSPGPGLPSLEKHKKEYGGVVLTLNLGGINKNNKHIVQDFIKQAAYVAAQNDLDVINAELEKQGKIGTSEPDISIKNPKLSGPEIDAFLAKMEKGTELEPGEMPSREQWSKMSPEERAPFVKAGSREAEWKAATEKDVANAREKARLRKSQERAGTLETFVVNPEESDPSKRVSLPVDTSLWTDMEWDIYNQKAPPEYKPSGQYSPRQGRSTAQGKKGAISGDFSQKLKH